MLFITLNATIKSKNVLGPMQRYMQSYMQVKVTCKFLYTSFNWFTLFYSVTVLKIK